VGLGGLIEPAALGVGYENLQAMLDGQFAIRALLILLLVKAVIWSVALGSGTSGGVLAPLLMIGGALGGLIGLTFSPVHATLFALLGMAAMMGGTMRSPLTATIFAVELTGNVHVLLPLITACTAAHAVTVLLLKRSILTERIARRGLHILRDYSVDPFEMARVKDVMVANVDTLPATMTVEAAVEFFTTDEHRHKTYPVVNEQFALLGMISRADILRWTVSSDGDVATVGDAVADDDLLVSHPDEMAGSLADRMAVADIGRVPVVDAPHGRLVGIVARKDLLRVRAKMRMHEQERSAPLRPGTAADA
jgi:CBS-domain-containing membrane protein